MNTKLVPRMLEREKKKLTKLVTEHILKLGGKRGKTVFGDSVEMELTTKAGSLMVTTMGNWIACRFADVARATLVVHSNGYPGNMNPFSGKWNFHFRDISAAQAFALFEFELSLIL